MSTVCLSLRVPLKISVTVKLAWAHTAVSNEPCDLLRGGYGRSRAARQQDWRGWREARLSANRPPMFNTPTVLRSWLQLRFQHVCSPREVGPINIRFEAAPARTEPELCRGTVSVRRVIKSARNSHVCPLTSFCFFFKEMSASSVLKYFTKSQTSIKADRNLLYGRHFVKK